VFLAFAVAEKGAPPFVRYFSIFPHHSRMAAHSRRSRLCELGELGGLCVNSVSFFRLSTFNFRLSTSPSPPSPCLSQSCRGRCQEVASLLRYLITSLLPLLRLCGQLRLPSSVHSSKFRIPQPLCLPLLRKLPGCVPTIPILERAIRLASLPRCLLTFLLPSLITSLLPYFTIVAVPPDHSSTVSGALPSFRT
jgi:hypothetical protein